MKLTFWHSAAFTLDTEDCRILCDPWFGYGNNWDGSWCAWPQLPRLEAMLQRLGAHDYIYISHLHDDHYVPGFLHAYLARYPHTQLLTSNEPLLRAALARDGLTGALAPRAEHGLTRWSIVRNAVCPIDSALAVIDGRGYACVNLNDNPYDAQQVAVLKELVAGAPNLLVAAPYLGAGEYPQTYTFATPEEQAKAADRKREQFLHQWERYLQEFAPTYALPFAGDYYLRGPLSALNRLRGLPDALEAVERAVQMGILSETLAFGGSWDLSSGMALGARHTARPLDLIHREIAQWDAAQAQPWAYRYAREIKLAPVQLHRVLPKLLPLAAQGVRTKGRMLTQPYWYYLGPKGGAPNEWWGAVDLGTGTALTPDLLGDERLPREEVRLDPRHAFGLLTGMYSWNVALVGSHLECTRVPNQYIPDVYLLLNALHI